MEPELTSKPRSLGWCCLCDLPLLAGGWWLAATALYVHVLFETSCSGGNEKMQAMLSFAQQERGIHIYYSVVNITNKFREEHSNFGATWAPVLRCLFTLQHDISQQQQFLRRRVQRSWLCLRHRCLTLSRVPITIDATGEPCSITVLADLRSDHLKEQEQAIFGGCLQHQLIQQTQDLLFFCTHCFCPAL